MNLFIGGAIATIVYNAVKKHLTSTYKPRYYHNGVLDEDGWNDAKGTITLGAIGSAVASFFFTVAIIGTVL